MRSKRTAEEVLDDHLRESKDGTVEADLARNYSPDLVVLTEDGVFRGHDGLLELTRRLLSELPDPEFEYVAKVVEGEFAFLKWRGKGGGRQVRDGADSYVIRDGKIVAQTIHYTVRVKQ